ncbi:MAG: SH3b protein, partial [Patescibacteria group bacterium]|nr:SH3b protein [Patescibacteria group bacterium]
MKRMRERALVLFSRIGVAIVALLFVVVAIMPNWVIPTNRATAAGDFSIKTGYYIGNGTTRSVTGLGFAPELVIIKSDTAAGGTVWKSSAMPAAVSTYFNTVADNTETEIVLESGGFTVSSALEVNTINTRYTYIAFYGSDCTASGVMCVGSYTGTGTASRTVTTGFQPDLVWSKRATVALGATFRTSLMSTNNAGSLAAAANDTTGVHFQTLDATGFTVGLTNNVTSGVYYYVAFKSLAGKLAVGQFTGDGVDNREITGVGFEPDFVLVKQNAALVAAYAITESWGDYSSFTTAAANAANSIQKLKADGFQVGNSTSVNALGIVSNYFAFGGSADPAPSGSFLMHRGSYVGTGVAQTIATPFIPDLVIVKGNATEYAVFSTSVSGGVTHYQGVGAAGILTGIGAMNGNVSSFSVGTHSTVNTNGNTYEYIVFGNATSPHKGAGASDFIIGAHTGNALTPRPIDHLGIDPDMVVATKSYTTGTATAIPWRSVSMAANNSAYFTAAANIVDGTAFRTLDADGFTIGSSNDVNTAGAVIVWYGFEEGAGFDVGTYTGNGVAGTNITAPGFAPDYVWTKRSTAVRGVHRSSSATITGAFAQHFLNVANTIDYITAFVSTGFTLGAQTEANANAGTYFYAAWDATASAAAPTTPTNSAPANATTGQDLAATLSGSAYNDTDGNAQIATEWQVDDDSSFATPVWTRAGGAEASTSVTSGNGTFANELAGKTELDHNSTYFWRVRYSDGVWSTWSTGTYFTTNAIVTPTHTAPTNASTVTTLTPTLSASAFSDPQSGHTASSSQWLISTTNDFSNPLHDSGAISYGASYAVPAAVLSNQSAYHWSV